MTAPKPEPSIKKPFDVSQLQTNGKFDTNNPDGVFMSAVWNLVFQREKQDPREADDSWRVDDLLRIAKKSPELIAIYLPMLSKPRAYGETGNLLNIIDVIPAYATELKEIFEAFPELVGVYTSFCYSLRERDEDTNLPHTRIIQTPQKEAVQRRIDANRGTYELLMKKLDDVTPKEDIPGSPYYELAYPYDVGRLVIVKSRMNRNDKDTLLIRLLPTDLKAYDFLSFDWHLRSNGLMDSREKWGDYKNLGYCFKDMPIDEKAVVKALTEHPLRSNALTTALEGIPSIEQRLSSTHW